MEQNFQIKILEAQIRECFGRVVWSHKTQEKCADILTKRNNYIKNAQIILAGFITTGLLLRVFKGSEVALIISTILSAIQFAFTTYLKENNLGETIQKHNSAALELWNIREQYLSLLTDIKAEKKTPDEVIIKRDELQVALESSYKGSPRTFGKAYKKASEGLKQNEEYTFSDEEIDKFLPKELRKTP